MDEPLRRPRRGRGGRGRSKGGVSWRDAMLWFCFLGVLGLIGGMIGKFVTSDQAASTRNSEIESLLAVTPTNCTCAIPNTNATSPVTPSSSLKIWLNGNWGNSSDMTYFAWQNGGPPTPAWNYHLNIGTYPNVFGSQLIPGATLPVGMIEDGYQIDAVAGDGTGEGYWVVHGSNGATGYDLTFLSVPTDGTALSYELIGPVTGANPWAAGYDGTRLIIKDEEYRLISLNTTAGASGGGTLESFILVDKATLGIGSGFYNGRMDITDVAYDPTTGQWWVLYIDPVWIAGVPSNNQNYLRIGTWDPDTPMTDNPTQYFITRYCYNFDRVIETFTFDALGRMWFVDDNTNNPSNTSPRYIYSSDLKPCSES